MNEWVEYLNDRSVVLPTEGYIEYVTTDGEHDTGFHDTKMGYDDIIWNRASPVCVRKFRVVDKEYYIIWKRAILSTCINHSLQNLTSYMNELNGLEKL